MKTRAAMSALLAVFLTLGSAVALQAQIIQDAESQLRLKWLDLKRNAALHPDERVQRVVSCLAYAIIDVVPEEFQALNWEVLVIDDPGFRNAEVLPEGKIIVYSGIFQAADTTEKLAAVIGHEVAHLTENHVKERVRRATGTGLLGTLGGAVTGLGGGSQQAARVLFQLPYQREQEREADVTGMMYMARAGYNPVATIDLWKGMSAGREGAPPEWLTTHPDPELRLQFLARNLTPALLAYNESLDAGVRPLCRL